MMRFIYNLTLIVILSSVVSTKSYAQYNFYFGIEAGPKWHQIEGIGFSDRFELVTYNYRPVVGVVLGLDLSPAFSVESGFSINTYGEGFAVQGGPLTTVHRSSGLNAYQVPLRLKYGFNLFRNRRLRFNTILGYTVAFNDSFRSSKEGTTGSMTFDSNGTLIRQTSITCNSTYGFKKVYGLIETGFSIEYFFKSSLSLTASLSYLAGTSKIWQNDYTYSFDQGPEHKATAISNGSYTIASFGMRYPISRIFRKKS